MTMRIGELVIHDLGYDGEHHRLSVVWPLDRLRPDDEGTPPDVPPGIKKAMGYCGLVLKMNPSDLPRYAQNMSLVHFNVSQAWQDKARAEVERREETAIIDRLRLWAGTTQHGAAAAEVRAILDSNLERER